jgi:hypothetical protein
MSNNNEVGFGKPPKHSRFKPGQSGNSRGRPKGRVPTTQLLEQHLNAKITVTVGGTQKTITRREALIIGLVTDALKGKDRVRKQVLDLLLILEAKMSPEAHAGVSDVHDDAVINNLLQRYGVKPSVSTDSPTPPKAPVKIKIIKANKKDAQ